MKQIKIICDETNNSQESINQGYLNIDLIEIVECFVLKVIVKKDGKIVYL